MKRLMFFLLLGLGLTTGRAQAGTVVRFTTNMGVINVELDDTAAPATVSNFLSYVNAGTYNNTIIHRSAKMTDSQSGNSIIQGGGFDTTGQPIAANSPIQNESSLANKDGTLAMARTSDPNSATNEWFFNVLDNSPYLPATKTDGYAVFGTVLTGGMSVVNAIAALPTYAFQSPFGELPLQNYTQADYNAGKNPDSSTLVIIQTVAVVPAFENPLSQFDVNNDGAVSPLDALNLINEINAHGSHTLTGPYAKVSGNDAYYDVNGDGSITPLDVLQIVNKLNAPSGNSLAGGVAEGLAPMSMAAAPEPGSLALASLAGVGILWAAARGRLRRAG